ncbi:CPBP family intramembrane glutamic endopeptidase [Myxococcus xanthus]|uniref:CPBP family intramembrane metalloprotease n=1 Tax=Myxococcus xanthus TaxID=34 RepID=A0A7Y4IDK9_MYXXA|nr:type II CAAX endopeptidase family protein [Myxococcus xanthus]NOJ77282.1 CPBP family intramembrane metalloprotease [Myxococcus xanthus]NOJ85521.1 CPBP family intramembrane metalloprotease [Myxococcus xanthus]
MSNVYLEQASRGRNQPWRYVLTAALVGLAVVLFNAPYSAFLFLAASRSGDAAFRFDPVAGVVEGVPFPVFAVGMLSFAVVIAALALGVRAVHKRPFSSLLGQEGGFRVRPFLKAAAGAFGVLSVAAGVNVLMDRESFILNFDASRFFVALALVLVLTPIQAAAEELLYRGWLMQGVYRLLPRPWVAVAVSSLLFWAAHLPNPEASGTPGWSAAYYLTVGILLAWVTLRTGRLETAMGLHAGMNLCAFLVTAPATVMFRPASLIIDAQPNSMRDVAFIALLAVGTVLVLRRADDRPFAERVSVQ